MFLQSGFVNCLFNGGLYILHFHGIAQFPVNDIAAVIIQNGTQVIPALSQDFKVSKISLPHFLYKKGLLTELIAGGQ